MNKNLRFITFLLLLTACGGCNSVGKMPNPFSGAGREPRQSVAVWSPAARVVNGVPERGFAARVTFFDGKSKKGIKVDGDIVVFAFDEYPHRSASNNAPDKSYPILAEDLKKVHSHSKELGHSYSLWVPWDNAGPEGERKTVSLIVKLVPKNGVPLLSGQAKCVLPGREPVFADSRKTNQQGTIEQVSYQFGRNDRFDEQLPPGFRDWTKADIDAKTPEEREISMGNRPTRMMTTSIPIPRATYAAVMQNNGPVNFVSPNPMVAQNAPTPNAIVAASYNNQPNNTIPQFAVPQNMTQNMVPQYPANPQPTDIQPPVVSNPAARTEVQGNTTITYSNEPRQFGGYGSSTNPLSHRTNVQ